MRSSKNPTSVFNPDFLDRLSHRDRSGSTFSEAEYAGPWTVRQREDGFAVLREADSGAGTPDAVFTEREIALLIAAVYPTMGREQRFQVATSEDAASVDVSALVSGKLEKAGWLRHMHPELVEALNVVEWLLRSLASLALLLEAASFEVLAHAEKILERRLAERNARSGHDRRPQRRSPAAGGVGMSGKISCRRPPRRSFCVETTTHPQPFLSGWCLP